MQGEGDDPQKSGELLVKLNLEEWLQWGKLEENNENTRITIVNEAILGDAGRKARAGYGRVVFQRAALLRHRLRCGELKGSILG